VGAQKMKQRMIVHLILLGVCAVLIIVAAIAVLIIR